jgi:F0F1-type ATP synthase assembly protein I
LAQESENLVYKVGDMLPAGMTPDAAPSPHSLATASGLLLGALAAAMIVGALVGWALGSTGIGLLVGALVGIPLGVLVVYQVYGRASRP